MSAKPDSPLGTAIVLALFLVVLVFCGVIWKQAHIDSVLPSGYEMSDEEQQKFVEQVDKWVKGEGPLPPSPLSPAEQSEMAWEEDQENRPEPKTAEEIDQRFKELMDHFYGEVPNEARKK